MRFLLPFLAVFLIPVQPLKADDSTDRDAGTVRARPRREVSYEQACADVDTALALVDDKNLEVNQLRVVIDKNYEDTAVADKRQQDAADRTAEEAAETLLEKQQEQQQAITDLENSRVAWVNATSEKHALELVLEKLSPRVKQLDNITKRLEREFDGMAGRTKMETNINSLRKQGKLREMEEAKKLLARRDSLEKDLIPEARDNHTKAKNEWKMKSQQVEALTSSERKRKSDYEIETETFASRNGTLADEVTQAAAAESAARAAAETAAAKAAASAAEAANHAVESKRQREAFATAESELAAARDALAEARRVVKRIEDKRKAAISDEHVPAARFGTDITGYFIALIVFLIAAPASVGVCACYYNRGSAEREEKERVARRQRRKAEKEYEARGHHQLHMPTSSESERKMEDAQSAERVQITSKDSSGSKKPAEAKPAQKKPSKNSNTPAAVAAAAIATDSKPSTGAKKDNKKSTGSKKL